MERFDDPKLTTESDVVVPLMQAAAVATSGGLGGGIMTLLLAPLAGVHGLALWSLAGRIAAGVFALALMTCTASFILAHRRRVTEPLDILWQRLAPPVPPEPEPRWIVRNPAHAARAIPARLASEAKPLEPDAPAEIKDLYKFITTMWPTGDISQANCARMGFSRKYWDRYIGGSRRKRDAGKESARGLLDRAGVVRKDGNKWVIAATLEEALSVNDLLREYAGRKAQMVRL